MPTSQFNQLNKIIKLIVTINPNSVLDIGVGFGKYGVLTREYLEFSSNDNEYNNWTRQIDGIEIFEKYINPIHRFVYNHIFIGNAIDILPTLDKKYDLLLLIDVLEHFDYESGMKVLKLCKKAAHNILISVPKDIGEQKESFENPNEKHEFQWNKKLLKANNDTLFISDPESVIALISDEVKTIKNKISSNKQDAIKRSIKMNLKHHFPGIHKIYKKMKSKN